MSTKVSRRSRRGKRGSAGDGRACGVSSHASPGKKQLGPRRNPPMQSSSQRKKAIVNHPLFVAIATTAAVLAAVGTTVVVVISFVADNASLRAALDTKTIAGVYAVAVSFGVIVLLLSQKTANLFVRWLTILVVACLCCLIGVQALPKVWKGLTPDPKKFAPNVLAPQSFSMRLDNVALSNEAHSSQNLRLARIVNSRISDVDFSDSNLTEADLRQSVFTRVNFAGADLCGADIRGSDLSRAIELGKVSDWNFVLYDATTKFPARFDVSTIYGPILYHDTGILYSCEDGQTRQLLPDGNRS